MTKLVCGSPSPLFSALSGGRHCPGNRSPELTPWCRGATREISTCQEAAASQCSHGGATVYRSIMGAVRSILDPPVLEEHSHQHQCGKTKIGRQCWERGPDCLTMINGRSLIQAIVVVSVGTT